VEGTLAANAHAWGSYNAGFMSSAQFSGPTTEIAAQAIGLYEMENPGALGRGTRGDTATMAEIRGVVEGALQAYEAGQLTPRAGELAQGWVETYPELSPEDKKLGELPGFTPERIEAFVEEYPAVDLGLPTHTGSPPAEIPDTTIISTPIATETGPIIVEMADPNNAQAEAAQRAAADRVRAAFPGAVVEENREYLGADGQILGEVDIIAGGVPIEVTIGRGKGKLEQAGNIEGLVGEAPVIYGPNIGGTVERNLRDAGFDVVRTLDDLEAALRDRGLGN